MLVETKQVRHRFSGPGDSRESDFHAENFFSLGVLKGELFISEDGKDCLLPTEKYVSFNLMRLTSNFEENLEVVAGMMGYIDHAFGHRPGILFDVNCTEVLAEKINLISSYSGRIVCLIGNEKVYDRLKQDFYPSIHNYMILTKIGKLLEFEFDWPEMAEATKKLQDQFNLDVANFMTKQISADIRKLIQKGVELGLSKQLIIDNIKKAFEIILS
jgi:hypothetical protein